MVGGASEHVAELGAGIEAVELRGFAIVEIMLKHGQAREGRAHGGGERGFCRELRSCSFEPGLQIREQRPGSLETLERQ